MALALACPSEHLPRPGQLQLFSGTWEGTAVTEDDLATQPAQQGAL